MLHIAKNKAYMAESLFKPLPHGGTYDGYIIKRTQNTVLFFALGREYLVNKHNVLCSVSRLPDGKTWYSYADFDIQDKIGGYLATDEFCKALKRTN